jgi:cystathionine gamma-synthase
VREYLKIMGGCIDANTSYLLIRGLKTFELRMQRLNENGQKIAEFLESHPKVKRVYYPGLPSHPHYNVAKTQMKGFGGVVTFEVKDDIAYALKFLSRLRVVNIGPSLGGVESLITHPATISYYAISRKSRLALGIKDGLIRLAVGVENAEDIIDDLNQSLF